MGRFQYTDEEMNALRAPDIDAQNAEIDRGNTSFLQTLRDQEIQRQAAQAVQAANSQFNPATGDPINGFDPNAVEKARIAASIGAGAPQSSAVDYAKGLTTTMPTAISSGTIRQPISQTRGPDKLVFGGAGKPAAKAGVGGPTRSPYQNIWDSYKSQQAAIGEQSTAQQHINDDAATGAGLRGQEQGAQKGEILSDAKAHDDEARASLDKLDKYSKEVADEKVDPDHWWQSKNVLQKGAWVIAAALQGFNAGRSGGPNLAFQQMNAERNADIDAQAKNIEGHRGRIADMKGLVADQYRRFGNLDQAKSAARIASLEQINSQTQEYAAGSQNEMVRANADKMSAEMQTQIEKEKLALLARGKGGPTAEQISKLAVEISKSDAANGISTTPEQARARAYSFLGGRGENTGFAAKGGVAGDAAGVVGPELQSTAAQWDHPSTWLNPIARNIPGTDTNKEALRIEQAATPVKGYAHKAYGARTPEAQEHLMEPYMPKVDDPPWKLEAKRQARRALVQSGQVAPEAAAETDPEGFDEAK